MLRRASHAGQPRPKGLPLDPLIASVFYWHRSGMNTLRSSSTFLLGNRVPLAQVHSSSYRAFDSINYPPLATLGVDVDWNLPYLLKVSPS